MVYLLSFALLCALVYSSKFDPTNEEISRGLVSKPKGPWGQRVRKENSLRLLCIGGSNTERDEGHQGYVSLLHQYVQQNITTDTHFIANSYVLNRGVSGQLPIYFTGKKFDFEDYDLALWPNVVLMEFSVNSGHTYTWDVVCKRLEVLVRSIMYKYKVKGLPSPDFMLYEVLFMRDVFLQSEIDTTTEARANWMMEFSTTLLNKTRNINMWQTEVASFYGFPVLSWGEVTFPALLRYFLSDTRSLYEFPWDYSSDGVHMSIPFGTNFAVNNILGPFFKDMMKPREEGTPPPFDMRMFAPSKAGFELVSYSSLDHYSSLPLTDILHNDSDWTMTGTIHNQVCFGSEVKNSVGRLQFTAPEKCKLPSSPCGVAVSFMHSWDTKFVGRMQCTVYTLGKKNDFVQKGPSIMINGQASVGQATAPVKSPLNKNIEAGLHGIQCVNVDGKHACLTALDISVYYVV